MAASNLTAARLRELLHYEPATGVFTRIVNIAKYKAGEIAGTIERKRCGSVYWMVGADGGTYYAHRLAWLYMTGSWPTQEVDHIDGDGLNNRFANLRDVSRKVNGQNARRPHKDSRSGILGVSWVVAKRAWRASITVNGKPHCIGLYETPEQAHAAYLARKRAVHEGCTL